MSPDPVDASYPVSEAASRLPSGNGQGNRQNGARQRSKAVVKTTREYLDILALLLEAGTPLSALDCPGLRILLSRDKSHHNDIPHAKSLYLLVTDLYGQYHHYFENWFESHPQQSISLTFHEWHRGLFSLLSIFVKAHYINDQYSQRDLFLGLVENGDLGLAGLLSNCPMIPDLGARLNTVTSNFDLGPKSELVLQHITGDPSFPGSRVIPCIPKRLSAILKLCFTKIASSLQRQVNFEDPFAQNSENMISPLIIGFLGPTFRAFLTVELGGLRPQSHPANSNINPSHNQQDSYNLLKNVFMCSTKARAFDYLAAILYFQDQFKELAREQQISISDSEWTAAEFAYCLSTIFQEVILGSESGAGPLPRHPHVHMLLKWIKVCIARAHQISMTFPSLFTIGIEEPLSVLLSDLQDLHLLLELKQCLLIAGYLHPNTKKYLSPAELDAVKNYVNECNSSSKTRKQDQNSNSLDDEIFRMFNCSGSTKSECNLYDTHALKEIEYGKGLPYLTAESGGHLLDFWRARHRKYPVLSSLARTHLSIQVNTNLPFQSAKILDVSGFGGNDCSQVYGLRPLYFYHSLAENYHVRRFDPASPGANIEDVARFHSDVRLDSGESSFCETSTVYPDEQI